MFQRERRQYFHLNITTESQEEEKKQWQNIKSKIKKVSYKTVEKCKSSNRAARNKNPLEIEKEKAVLLLSVSYNTVEIENGNEKATQR